jgi:hypothetical protein
LDVSVDGEHLDGGSRNSQPEKHSVDLGQRAGQQPVVHRAGRVHHDHDVRDRAT